MVPYVYLLRLIHDMQSLFVMLNNFIYTTLLEYLKRTNIHYMMITTMNFSTTLFPVFVYIFHNLETSSNKLPIVNSKLNSKFKKYTTINLSVTVNVDFPLRLYFHKIAGVERKVKPLFSTFLCSG